MTDPRVLTLIDAHAAARQRIEDRIEKLVAAEFTGFDGWYSPRMVDAVTASVAAKVAAAQLGVAQITDAYLARVSSYVFERTIVGPGVPQVMGATLRYGVASHEEVYARVAAEYRRQKSLGEPEGAALTAATVRAREMVSTDMGLAFQRQTAAFNRHNRINAYRRVVRPEMSMGGSCGLCVAASDRLYFRDNLLPIHARCKCTVIPVTANTDPGSQLNAQTLGELYGAADSTAGPELKKVRVEIFNHGELGPQLRVKGHRSRGPAEVAAA